MIQNQHSISWGHFLSLLPPRWLYAPAFPGNSRLSHPANAVLSVTTSCLHEEEGSVFQNPQYSSLGSLYLGWLGRTRVSLCTRSVGSTTAQTTQPRNWQLCRERGKKAKGWKTNHISSLKGILLLKKIHSEKATCVT